MTPAGLLPADQGRFVLLVERDNLEIKEVRTTSLDEQTARVEIFSIAVEEQPD